MKQYKKISLFTIIILSSTLFIILNPFSAEASLWDSIWSGGGDENTVKFLEKYQDYLDYGSFLSIIFHMIGWLLVKGLYFLTSGIESLIPQSLSLLDFLDDSGFQGVFKAVLNDLVVVLMVLALVWLGIKTVVAKEPPKFKSVGVNIMISALLLMGLPSLLNMFEDISTKFYSATQKGNNNGEVSSLTWNLIQNNTTDLVYISSKGFSTLDNANAKGNALTPKNFRYTDLNALITPSVVNELDGEEIKNLAYKLNTDENGKDVAEEIEGNAFGFLSDSFKEGYFRYQVKFTPMIVGLIALFVAYLFTLFVFISTVIEIGFKQIVGVLVFATDLESGQKTKMVVQDILNAFMLIAFTGLGLKIYTLFLTYLSKTNINVLVYSVALVSATFVLIKGSNTIMRYFGVDVGLKDGFAQMAGAFAVGRATAGTFNGFKNMMRNGNKSNPEGATQQRQALQEQSATSMKSVNDAKNAKNPLRKGLHSVGQAVGYANERGIGGAIEDTVKGTQSKLANSINNQKEKVTGGLQGLREEWQQGVSEGATVGQNNQEKWQQQANQKSINDSNSVSAVAATTADTPNVGNKRIQERLERELSSIDNVNGRTSTSNPTLQEQTQQARATGQLETPKSTLQGMNAEATMRTNSVQPTLRDVTANARINPSSSITNGAQSVTPSMQKILQQVDQLSFVNPTTAKQAVMQEVKQSTFRSPEMKQKVLQEIEKASVATPQQAKQNIQQVIQNAPMATQQAVQQVIQEVQKGNGTAETLQSKVVQEIQKADFGNDGKTVKQAIVQDVQKAFNATPGQLQQNIKQTLLQAHNSPIKQESSNNVTQLHTVKQNMEQGAKEERYFGKYIKVEFPQVERERKNNRFAKFNQK